MKRYWIGCSNCFFETPFLIADNLSWLPPCSRCNGILEGFIIKEMVKQDATV